ncbi:MAG: ribbon-helix-helix protein, CopG family [Chloroflexota bacterium]
MVRTQIQLTEHQSRTLKRLSRRQNLSVAELIRRSVDAYIDATAGPSSAEREKRLLSVIGIGRSDLPDLGLRHDQYLTEVYAEVAE